MTTTPTTATKAMKKKPTNRWRLSITYPSGNTIAETFAVGKTKQQTMDRWFLQFYCGSVPSGARIPKNAISITWMKIFPSQ